MRSSYGCARDVATVEAGCDALRCRAFVILLPTVPARVSDTFRTTTGVRLPVSRSANSEEVRMANTTRMQRRPTTPSPFGLFPLLTRDIDQLQANMRRILQNQPASSDVAAASPQALAWTPAVEISETNDELTITAELPGIDADEVHVMLDGDVLTIRGEKKSERREGDENTQYYLVERSYGVFQRSFTLPSTVDPESIAAEFNNGVLTVHLKKMSAERSRGREIPISATSNGGTNASARSGASNAGAQTASSGSTSGSASGAGAGSTAGSSSQGRGGNT
jgi:HSP20 family protein